MKDPLIIVNEPALERLLARKSAPPAPKRVQVPIKVPVRAESGKPNLPALAENLSRMFKVDVTVADLERYMQEERGKFVFRKRPKSKVKRW